jgi:hypothetical protein
MILYHGTDARHLESILTRGILPRSETGNIVYQEPGFASNASFCYLSRWFPVAHAYSIEDVTPLILRVDVDPDDLYPDEDFLERLHFMKTGKPGRPEDFDIAQHKELAAQCLRVFGSVAVRRVPPSKILGYKVLDPADFDYHCGIGAQGTQLIQNPSTSLHVTTSSLPVKYMRRLELLFASGWDAVKREILKEPPSEALTIQRPTQRIKYQGYSLRVLPVAFPTHHVCDVWQETFPIKLPTMHEALSRMVHIPI